MTRILRTTLAALAAATAVTGHSWVEQLRNIDSNGSYVGQYGYPRGMVSRTDPGFTGDSMNWELPASNDQGRTFINASDLLCHPGQRNQTQSQAKYPRLQAVPGGFIAMRYQENGHTTFPQAPILGKQKYSGTIYVYLTNQPKSDEKLVDVLQWTKDGQGGDKRGSLIGMNNFDDGRCYLLNASPISQDRQKSNPDYMLGQVSDGPANSPLYCETDVQLPANVQANETQTLYWVWQWPTLPGVDPGLPNGKDEYYTTCIDVDVVSNHTELKAAVAAVANTKFAIGQQDAMTVAVQGWNSRTALATDPIKGEVGPIFSSLLGNDASSATTTVTAGAPGPSAVVPVSTKTKTRTHTKHAGASPTALPQSGSGFVTVTDTAFVTVTVPAATQPAGTPAAGTPSAGTPPAGTPPSGTPPSGAPPSGTPPVGTPPSGTPLTGSLPVFSLVTSAVSPSSAQQTGGIRFQSMFTA